MVDPRQIYHARGKFERVSTVVRSSGSILEVRRVRESRGAFRTESFQLNGRVFAEAVKVGVGCQVHDLAEVLAAEGYRGRTAGTVDRLGKVNRSRRLTRNGGCVSNYRSGSRRRTACALL